MIKPLATVKSPVWGITLLSLLLFTGASTPSWAETVLKKVTRTGVLTAGTRSDAIPFAYSNDQQDFQGYSVDMLGLIKSQLEQELGKELTLKLLEVNPKNRLSMVKNGEVDIVCGSTSFTWERNKSVDFSISYAVNGTGLLVKSGSPLGSVQSLINKRIGAIPTTTNAQAIARVQPQATIVEVPDAVAGLAALKDGKVDAFAWDGILLEGLRRRQPNPESYTLLPDSYAREGIACILPQDNSRFRGLVDYSLFKFMEGYVQGDQNSVAIVDRWFGPQGVIPIDRRLIREFFVDVIDTR